MRKLNQIRREAILAAAAEEFSECGYEGASIAAIAARIGGSKPTIYRYFPSKEELFAEFANRTAEAFMKAADAELLKCDDLVQTLVEYGCRYLSFRQTSAGICLTRLVYGEAGRSEIGRLVWNGAREAGLQKIGHVLAAAMDRGKLRPSDPRVLALHLFGLLDAELVEPVVWGVREPALAEEIREVVGRAVDAFIAAYRP